MTDSGAYRLVNLLFGSLLALALIWVGLGGRLTPPGTTPAERHQIAVASTGMTRGVRAGLHGDLQACWQWNPAAPGILLFALVQVGLRAWLAWRPQRSPRFRRNDLILSLGTFVLLLLIPWTLSGRLLPRPVPGEHQPASDHSPEEATEPGSQLMTDEER